MGVNLTLHEINVLGTVLGALSLTVTLWRLWYRWSQQKLWWDDAWASFTQLSALIPVVCVWFIFASPESGVTQTSRVIAFYWLEVGFTFTIWGARLSILWTIIRITPDRFMRRILYGIAGAFILFAVVLSAQKFWVCVPQKEWVHKMGEVCSLGKQVAISEIVTDVTGDAILILFPIKLLWNVKVTRSLRIRLFLIFSMSILTTIVSLAQNYYLIHEGGLANFVVSHVELQVAAMTCSLNVIVAAIYKFKSSKDLEETTAHHTKNPTRQVDTFASRRGGGNRTGFGFGFGTSTANDATSTLNGNGGMGGNGGHPTQIHIQTETVQWSSQDKASRLEDDDSEDEAREMKKPHHDEEAALGVQTAQAQPQLGVPKGNAYQMRNMRGGNY